MLNLKLDCAALEEPSIAHNAVSPSAQSTSESVQTDLDSRQGENSEGVSATRFKALQVDGGQLTFHGATSFFHLPGSHHDNPAEMPPALSSSQAGANGKDKLTNSAWKERAFEQLANIPEPMKSLLRDHWTWISPLFNFVYRPAFTRDIKSSGTYYSEGLFNTILAHSVRWAKKDQRMSELLKPYDGGAHFYRQAVAAIFDDVKQGPGKIPQVQSLLLLSAQSIGKGHRTQAWLYTGMAIRIIEDMGLNIDSRSYATTANLSDEDIEIRSRLFWSCYAWEKMLCLYLGRQPVFLATHASPPQLLLDDSAEIEVWSPSGIGIADEQDYPPTQSHATSCFINMASLSEVLHRILTHLYDPLREMSEEATIAYVVDENKNLQSWWDKFPAFLKISPSDLPLYCPPSHVATLNAMFHMVKILLNRPILCAQGASEVFQNNLEHHVTECSSSANAIISIFDLYTRTFGNGHIMTALIYCVYTAASIFLLQIQATKQDSTIPIWRLKYCINALESVKGSAPIISTAVKLIQREVSRLGISDDELNGDHTNPFELFGMPSEEPNAYEWAAVGSDVSLLPQQWGDTPMMGDVDDTFYDNFFLAADVHSSSSYVGFDGTDIT